MRRMHFQHIKQIISRFIYDSWSYTQGTWFLLHLFVIFDGLGITLNPVELRKAKIASNFELSECNRVKHKKNPKKTDRKNCVCKIEREDMFYPSNIILTIRRLEGKSVDSDGVAHNELSHLDLHFHKFNHFHFMADK